MENLATISTVASIFLLLLTGYGAKRFGVLKPADTPVVNSIIINLMMPAFIFTYTHQMPLTSAMIRTPFLGFAMEMIILAAAYGAGLLLRLDRRTIAGLMLAAAFGNTGFLGYPMVNAAFHHNKHAMLTAVMFDQFAMSLALNSTGVAVAASLAGKKFEWQRMFEFLKTPLFPATVIALALRTVYIPPIITKTLSFLAAGVVPLAMISIGLNLSARSLGRYPAALGAGILLKMAALPALMYLTLPLIGVGGVIGHVAILEGAVPTAVVAGVIAGKYGANEEFVAAAIFVMTLLSVVTIPLTLMLVR